MILGSDVHPVSPSPHILPDLQKGAPLTNHAKRDAPFLEPSTISKIPSQRTSQVPHWAATERDTHLQSFLLHLSLEVPGKRAPLHVLQQGPYRERSFISRDNGLFIHLYLSESPIRSPPTKNGENMWSPSMEPHMDGRPTFNGVRPGFPRGLLHHCYVCPSAMQPSARYLPPWLG
jgi:hypothetical protein